MSSSFSSTKRSRVHKEKKVSSSSSGKRLRATTSFNDQDVDEKYKSILAALRTAGLSKEINLQNGQLKGVEWMIRFMNPESQKRLGSNGAILAHKVGGGKTIQLLSLVALSLEAKCTRTSLVIAPGNVVSQWVEAVYKFFGGRSMNVGTYNNIANKFKIYDGSVDANGRLLVVSKFCTDKKSGPTYQMIDSCQLVVVHYQALTTIASRSGAKHAAKVYNSYMEEHSHGYRTLCGTYNYYKGKISGRGGTATPSDVLAEMRKIYDEQDLPSWICLSAHPITPLLFGRNCGEGAPPLLAYHYEHMALDEAHHIRNPTTDVAQIIFAMGRNYSWALTGTPVYHKDVDLWSLLKLIEVNGLRGYSVMRKAMDRVRAANEKRKQDEEQYGWAEARRLDSRREQTGSLQEEERNYVEELIATYMHTLDPSTFREEATTSSEDFQVIEEARGRRHPHEKAGKCSPGVLVDLWHHYEWLPNFDDGLERQAYINTQDESFYGDGVASSSQKKVSNLDRILSEAVPARKQRSGSGFELVKILRARMAVSHYMALPERMRKPSSSAATTADGGSTKARALLRYIQDESRVRPDEKLLVFGEHVLPLELTKLFLEKNGVRCMLLGGKSKNVAEIFESMRVPNSDGGPIVLLSTFCAEQGLNMQFVNHVIFFTHMWAKSRMEQAIGRAYRPGQRRDVHVLYLMIDCEIDRRIKEVSEDGGKLTRSIMMQISKAISREGTQQRPTRAPLVPFSLIRDEDDDYATTKQRAVSRRAASYDSTKSPPRTLPPGVCLVTHSRSERAATFNAKKAANERRDSLVAKLESSSPFGHLF